MVRSVAGNLPEQVKNNQSVNTAAGNGGQKMSQYSWFTVYDYSDLLDELIVLNRQEDLNKYRKRIRYYARIQLLFIDDFAISRYSEEGIKILYHLIKLRDDLGTSTLFTCQYSPDEWGNQLSDEKECYGKLDGIRRRLTTGFTVLIEKA